MRSHHQCDDWRYNCAFGWYVQPDHVGTGEGAALTGDLELTKDVTIFGADACNTIIDGGGLDRVFDVQGATVNIADLTIQNGNSGNEVGGALRNNSTGGVTLRNVIITGNSATGESTTGGAIENAGDLTLVDVEISNNATGGWGGGVYNTGGTVTMNCVAVTGNTAGKDGAGIYSDDRNRGCHIQRGGALSEHVVADRIDGGVRTSSPAAVQAHAIAAVAVHRQGVGFVGDVQHLLYVQDQRVITAAGDVDLLDPEHAVVRNGGQIQ